MSWQISKLMISLVLISLFAGVFGSFMAKMSNDYDISYDNSTLESYNKLSEITNTTQDVQNRTSSATRDSTGVVDALSGFFSDAYKAILITAQSFNVFEDMSNKAFSQANLGPSSELFRVSFVTIVLIVIFVGIIIAAIIKRDA